MREVTRILSIDPMPRGFAYAVLEDAFLVDYGILHVKGDRDAATLQKIREFLAAFRPDTLVFEAYGDPSCRLGPRARNLLWRLHVLAYLQGVTARHVSRAEVQSAFVRTGKTKHAIACRIAALYPELQPRLPRKRKPWMSEDERMGIFDAISFSATILLS
jgi:hypothetical protein